jgi:hypothetical protein
MVDELFRISGERAHHYMKKQMKWEAYDPTWIIQFVEEHFREELWLVDALSVCTRCLRESKAYLYFVNPDEPNTPNSAWQFDRNIILEHPREGTLILDILQGHRVGGIEFLARLK